MVALVGLIAGVLLALASHFLRVEEDETVTALRACLPGVNCGACGYAGCDDYARALAEKKAKTNLCIPGADAASAQIAEILGVQAEDTQEMIAIVKCNGNCNAAPEKFHYEGVDTCRAASMLYGGPKACRFGCLGCGDCAAVCPVNAICIQDGIAHVDRRICIGCGLCAKTCPKNIIGMFPAKKAPRAAVLCSSTEKGAVARKNCQNACIGCKKCAVNCPENAITVENNLALIDFEKCTGCGTCIAVCPTHCIHPVEPYAR